MYPNLRAFLSALDRAGELARVDARVSPVLEIAQIADVESKSPAPHLPSASARRNDPRFCHLGGRGLLFANVQGAEMPVAINTFGSYRRMEMALGCNEAGPGALAGTAPGGFDAIAARIAEYVKPEFPRSLGDAVRKARSLLPLLSIGPKRRRGTGACQHVVLTGDRVDLRRLPIIRCWPLDGDLASVGFPAGINDAVPGVESGAEWEREYRGRYITLGGIHTIHASDAGNPRPGSHNIGMYRVQLLGRRTMAMHWHVHHDGARHWRSWKARGEKMPVAIALGGPSVLPYAATCPLPPGISELLMAGFLNGGGIEMVMGRTVPIWVPAEAEIVIEGYVSAEAGEIGWKPGGQGHGPNGQRANGQEANSRTEDRHDPTAGRHRGESDLGPGAVVEGPFGDHTAYYSLPDRYPVLEVTAITHRRDPIYPTTIVGLPPQEDYYLGKATERVFLPLLRTIVPDIEDYDLPMFGAFHNCAMVKIDKAYALQGRRVMHSVWGAGQMAWTKSIFVVDDHVDVHDTTAVLRAAAEHCRPGRDTETANGPVDILDHAAPRLGVGMKIGFDCTVKRKEEGDEHDLAPAALLDEAAAAALVELVRRVPGVVHAELPSSCGHGWLLVAIEKNQPGDGVRACEQVLGALGEHDHLAGGATFVVVVDRGVNISSVDETMFHWCSNCDVSRDAVEGRDSEGRVTRLGFDATPKIPGDERNAKPVRQWPPLLEMSAEIVERVRARWPEYGL
ncbi:MAG: menaquinone biosynthesis decarboxylase [Phycisphaerae bacterium]